MSVVVNSAAVGFGGGGGTVSGGGNGNGDTAPLAFQTVTPNADGVTAISIDRNAGANVWLNPAAGPTQTVNAILNMTDGEAMQINMIGGANSPLWSAWSSGSPLTLGFDPITTFPIVPTSSAQYVAIYLLAQINSTSAKIKLTIGEISTV